MSVRPNPSPVVDSDPAICGSFPLTRACVQEGVRMGLGHCPKCNSLQGVALACRHVTAATSSDATRIDAEFRQYGDADDADLESHLSGHRSPGVHRSVGASTQRRVSIPGCRGDGVRRVGGRLRRLPAAVARHANAGRTRRRPSAAQHISSIKLTRHPFRCSKNPAPGS